MNVNFGIMPLPEKKIKGGKAARNLFISERSLEYIKENLLPALNGLRRKENEDL